VILIVAAFLAALGIGLWVLGYLVDMQAVTTIGGVIVFGVGVMLLSRGLSVPSGVTKTVVDNSTTVVQTQYRAVDLPTHLSLGFLVSITGGVLTLRGISQNT